MASTAHQTLLYMVRVMRVSENEMDGVCGVHGERKWTRGFVVEI